MQSLTYYSRFLVRAIVSELNGELLPLQQFCRNSKSRQDHPQRSFHLVTALSGVSKSYKLLPNAFYSSSFHNQKQRCFGDDSCFLAQHSTGDVLGVADGVGGWRSYGVDPSQFPKSLMAICERLVSEGKFNPEQPVNILSSSYEEIKLDKRPLNGSCTACLVSLHRESNRLYTANLGDSGFMVIRNGSIAHKSEEQQHYFNTPFQMSLPPTQFKNVVLCDSPTSANSESFLVEEGDVIVLGTDGLFDNLDDHIILHHVTHMKKDSLDDLQLVANTLVVEAHKRAFDPHYNSPFSKHAAANGFNITGGKPDDVTVMVALVTVNQYSNQSESSQLH